MNGVGLAVILPLKCLSKRSFVKSKSGFNVPEDWKALSFLSLSVLLSGCTLCLTRDTLLAKVPLCSCEYRYTFVGRSASAARWRDPLSLKVLRGVSELNIFNLSTQYAYTRNGPCRSEVVVLLSFGSPGRTCLFLSEPSLAEFFLLWRFWMRG
jgi:hypothetical protein